LRRLEKQLALIVPEWSMAPVVKAYQAMRGASFLVAVTFAPEIGDVRRFDTPRWAMTDDARPESPGVEVGFPFNTLGRSLSGGTGYPSLDLDFLRAESVVRLAARGHRRIAVVGPMPELNFAHLFRRGYPVSSLFRMPRESRPSPVFWGWHLAGLTLCRVAPTSRIRPAQCSRSPPVAGRREGLRICSAESAGLGARPTCGKND
jgi:hypothetical protein